MNPISFEETTAFRGACGILGRLGEFGHKAYLIGGCVRDAILSRPIKDYDIATSALPDEVEQIFTRTKRIGAKFGVVQVPYNTCEFEVATFRSDGAYSDNRRPDQVRFSKDLMEDVLRRDFSMNAIAVNPLTGEYLDLAFGERDIENRVIRAIGNPDNRFQEDALRMLRAVRFAAKLDFHIHEGTWLAIQRNAHLVKAISAERIAGELNEILLSGKADFGIALLLESCLLEQFMPEIEALMDCPQSPKWHPEGNVYKHTLGLLKQLPAGCSLTLALGCLLHDIGKPACLGFKEDGTPNAHGHEEAGEPIAAAILGRLKYPNEVIDVVKSHVRQHMTFSALPGMRRSKQLRFIRQPHIYELMELHRIDRMAAISDLTHYEFATALRAETPFSVMRPEPLIDGRDLIALGMTPGPAFKIILHTVESRQLDGEMTTKQEAIDYALAWIEENGANGKVTDQTTG
jgi:putative nucleotidyltransferase with HDIG domain